ncbi:MAG: DUF1330 domain-containing protein [Pseudomonadales bacterium]|nr:DUF1330 domain-containing protein [Pseudomonadales bacterium]
MTALIIVDLIPIDKDQMATYSALAAETLIPFGGEFIAKGPISSLHGDSHFAMKVVIQFPGRENAEQWYASKAYQEVIPIRDKGMESQFHLVG